MSKWRPISAAPKDGTGILVYTSERCETCEQDGTHMAVVRWKHDYWYMGKSPTAGIKMKHNPSHWMPLPKAPV